MGTAKQRRNSTRADKRASSDGCEGTRKDDVEPLGREATDVHAAVTEIMERERRNLQRACALLDCLRIASMYDYGEEVEAEDVAYVVSGLVSDTVNALDGVALRKAVRRHPSKPP
jgi:hypothetical protein